MRPIVGAGVLRTVGGRTIKLLMNKKMSDDISKELKGGAKRTPNKWIQFVNEYRKKHNLKLKDAIKEIK